MKPLQSVGMGLVIVVLSARVHGYDALPDPVGWLLVLAGVRALPAAVPQRGTLTWLGAVAAAVSAVIWVPSLNDALHDADPSLVWAADLPELAFAAVLCHGLAIAAGDADDRRAAGRLRLARTAVVAVALLPVLVFGAGVAGLEATSYVLAGLVAVALICLLFGYSGRPWARPVDAARTPGDATGAAPPGGGTAPGA